MTAPKCPPILDIQDLRFAYPDAPPLFENWSRAIEAGVTLVHGDTGSGKSTLLRVLAGALPAAAGRVRVDGAAVPASMAATRWPVFFVDPSTDAFDDITARACTASLRAGDHGFDEARWQALVDGFGLAPHLEKPMYMLSTGSKRKVWLAAALASSRPVVLLDEPTGALDAGSVRCLWEAVAAVAAEPGRAIVVGSCERIDRVPLVATIDLP